MAEHIQFYGSVVMQDSVCPHNCENCFFVNQVVAYLNALVASDPNAEIISWNFKLIDRGERNCFMIVAQVKHRN